RLIPTLNSFPTRRSSDLHDWQEDTVIDNYELHCHLVEQLLGMLAVVGQQLEPPVSLLVKDSGGSASGNSANVSYPHRSRDLEILDRKSTRLNSSHVTIAY